MLPGILEHFGIAELYPPQEEAIVPVERGESVLLAVPTAAGKTLVAYLALLRTVAAGRRGMYLVPLRARAGVKVEALRRLRVGGFQALRAVLGLIAVGSVQPAASQVQDSIRTR